MKNLLLFTFLSISFLSNGQFAPIPDPNFRAFLVSQFPTCFNSSQQLDTTCNDIINTTSLNVSGMAIMNVEGIQYFDNLINLDVSLNQITSLSDLPSSLSSLRCTNNQLTSLPDLPNMTDLNFAHNSISVLPNLPNIVSLNCESNQLASLPLLPGITTLHCGGNYLSSLPNFPVIQYLYCESNQLTDLLPYPNLLYLNCSYNLISTLPTLSNSLIELRCDNNRLKVLPKLPNSLIELWCNGNHLIALPKLPLNLNVLYCYGNHLFQLPTLPITLKQLFCGSNIITSLPALPNSLQTLFCDNNIHLTCLPKLPMGLATAFYSGSGVSCLPNFTNFLNTPICAGTCVSHPSCAGIIFNDVNLNGNFDLGVEKPVPNWVVTNSESWVSTTNNQGEYQLGLTKGAVNTIKPHKLHPYSTITPGQYVITPATNEFQGDNYNFALTLIPNVNDLRIDVMAGQARPGSIQNIYAQINNFGTTVPNNATLKIRIPGGFTFVSADPSITYQVGDTLIWDNITMDLFENKQFNILWTIPTSIGLSTPYQIQSWIFPIVADTTAGNNYYCYNGTTVASLDPNIKEVSKTFLLQSELGDDLVYTVHFQNTGTDTAFNILIQDQLSENLDVSTFQMLNASHAYDFTIRENGLLEVFFQNVQLVDSLTNEPESHGSFRYSIKPKNNLNVGDVIPNTAHIYFDYNPDVVTNSVYTTIVAPANINESAIISDLLFPNPTSGKAVVRISELSCILSISDLNGKILFKGKVNNNEELDFANYPNGIYIGKMETEKGTKFIKVIKQN